MKTYHGKAEYSQKLLCGTLAVVMLFGVVHMSVVKLPQSDNDRNYIRQNYDVLDTFDLYDDGKNYRVDAYQCYNNLGLYLDIPVIQFFNSTVNPSIMEFYPYVDVKRDVSSKPEYDNYALRSLLSVKYIVMPTHEYGYFTDDGFDNIYSEYMVTQPYQVLKNDYWLPFGFAYDYYITPETMDSINAQHRSKVMLKALMVDSDVVDKYKLSLEQLPDSQLRDYSFDAYAEDVENRMEQSSSHFEMNKDGFVSTITLEKPNLVFYSVPYDEGFTAFVNGVESEVIKVHNGLCAVYAPAGENEIVFRYRTVGLSAGIALTCAGLAIYAVYLLLIFKKKVKI